MVQDERLGAVVVHAAQGRSSITRTPRERGTGARLGSSASTWSSPASCADHGVEHVLVGEEVGSRSCRSGATVSGGIGIVDHGSRCARSRRCRFSRSTTSTTSSPRSPAEHDQSARQVGMPSAHPPSPSSSPHSGSKRSSIVSNRDHAARLPPLDQLVEAAVQATMSASIRTIDLGRVRERGDGLEQERLGTPSRRVDDRHLRRRAGRAGRRSGRSRAGRSARRGRSRRSELIIADRAEEVDLAGDAVEGDAVCLPTVDAERRIGRLSGFPKRRPRGHPLTCQR